ncbi:MULTISPECIES: hypothetical protein [unclassified Halomonas]|uniref:hypothetical protein n=1 Tax=unclassified Halomonas TaxID=2609666 RepID=UPI0007DA11B6|nr:MULTISPECIES: hypothetical protein [unclassified Halomonas]MBT2784778.1 hypothetical protein [Halomonas sp. ISL-106]MBT2796472.1 hypothetical protein [Halomonas sp. ISL-104]OAL59721.1 hypothetical protein A6R74_00120 [Halomonas sp. ALS9]
MAIDPNWVRENPEEAARQIDLLIQERDQYRHGELTQMVLRKKASEERRAQQQKNQERVEFLNKQNADQKGLLGALMSAKLEALPADLENRYVIVKIRGDIDQELVRKLKPEFRKRTAGCAFFVNMEADIETIDIIKRAALIKAEALFDMSEKLEAYDQPIAANQCWNEGDKFRRQAEGSA